MVSRHGEGGREAFNVVRLVHNLHLEGIGVDSAYKKLWCIHAYILLSCTQSSYLLTRFASPVGKK